MEHTAVTFDPLVALEAEYAAVIAQTKPPAEASTPSPPTGDAGSTGSDSEDEEGATVGGFESYALLPSSPCNSDAEAPDYEDNVVTKEDAEECPQSEMKTEEDTPKQQKEVAGLQEDKRLAIMQSMQQVKLRPPPWAEAANLTDDELLNLVQKQLGLNNST